MELKQTVRSIAMEGNKNASKARPFTDELRTHLFRDSRKRLNAVIGALLSKAEDGDVSAIKEIADRIEGKVQSSESAPNMKVVIIRESDPQPIDAISERLDDAEA